jgi:L-asparaginase
MFFVNMARSCFFVSFWYDGWYMNTPKLLLLFAGGTIGMVHNQETGALEPAASALELLQHIPELHEIAEIDFELVDNVDSSNMTPDHWVTLATRIAAQYDQYDGCLLYTSDAADDM